MSKTVLAPLFAARYCMISELRLVGKSRYLRIKSLCYEVPPSPSVRSYMASMVPIQEYISNFVQQNYNSSILTRIYPRGTRRTIDICRNTSLSFVNADILIHLRRHYNAANWICSDTLGTEYIANYTHIF